MKLKNISLGIHYENPIHKMEPYKKYFKKNSSPLRNSERLSKEIFSLPLHPFISKKTIIEIANEIILYKKKFNHEIQ